MFTINKTYQTVQLTKEASEMLAKAMINSNKKMALVQNLGTVVTLAVAAWPFVVTFGSYLAGKFVKKDEENQNNETEVVTEE